ncbi:hypothetical protein [Brazilian marseillevirus]|uniref:hypothetical protein n=1 Tax=Brazilian marseillevirus TaxID=1813599 RepID=UPI000783255C|nr:hypothetical protein A3303_gp193 [Brazilian marseillevirus]AMQ10701.1 hypothetical protein [Brazilian marseillevirus]
MENIISALHRFTNSISAKSSPLELELTKKRIQKTLELLELMIEKDIETTPPTLDEQLAEVNNLLGADEFGEVDGGIVGMGHYNPLEFPTVDKVLSAELEKLAVVRNLVWWVDINEDRSRIATCFSLLPEERLPKKGDFEVYISSSDEGVEIFIGTERAKLDCDMESFVKSFIFLWKANESQ